MPREHVVQQGIRGVLCAPTAPTRVWRNNVGGGVVITKANPKGSYLTWGLCEGSADLIGIYTRVITPEMVGQVIGQFLSVEVKTHAKHSKPSPEQLRWKAMVEKRGGIARIIRDKDTAIALIQEDPLEEQFSSEVIENAEKTMILEYIESRRGEDLSAILADVKADKHRE